MAVKTIPEILGLSSSVTPAWVAGFHRRGEVSMSTVDGEIYQKITADSNDTTDPANDTTNYLSRSYQRTTSFEDTSYRPPQNGVLRGTTFGSTLTLNTRTRVLNLTGRGKLTMLILRCSSVNGQVNLRYEVLVDGRSILDLSTSDSGSRGPVLLAAFSGFDSSSNPLLVPSPVGVQFRRGVEVYFTLTNVNVAGPYTNCGGIYAFSGEA